MDLQSRVNDWVKCIMYGYSKFKVLRYFGNSLILRAVRSALQPTPPLDRAAETWNETPLK